MKRIFHHCPPAAMTPILFGSHRHWLRITLVMTLWHSAQASAGVLWAPGINAAAFSFRPNQAESTPNYYAYGVDIGAGYSFAEVFDIAAKASYYPGNLEAPRFAKETAALIMYGGEIALRFSRSVYIGFRGGTYIWNSVLRQDDAPEVDGRWSGPGGGVGVGALIKRDRDRFWQVSLDAESFVGSNIEPEPVVADKRRIDLVKLSIAYVYNGAGQLPMFDSFVGNLFKAWGL